MSDLEFALLLSLSDVGTIRVCYRFFASETRGGSVFPFKMQLIYLSPLQIRVGSSGTP